VLRRGIAVKAGTAWRVGAAALSAFLLFCAYAPLSAPGAGWVAFIPLLLLARNTPPRDAFRWGMVSGLLFWLASLSWLLRLGDTGGYIVLVILGWILLAAYCSLYTGVFTMVVSRVFRTVGTERTWSNAGLVIGVPLLWVGFEYLRSTILTGFPWNTLGVSQWNNLAVIQVAEFGGVYAVSAVLMVMNTSVTLTAHSLYGGLRGRSRRRVHAELMVGLLICVVCCMYGLRKVSRLTGEPLPAEPLRVAALQPNIPQEKKWPEGHGDAIHEALQSLSRAASVVAPQLVVWPETAVPGILGENPVTTAFVADMAQLGSPLLVGTLESVSAETWTETFYNSAFLVDTNGTIVEKYRKRHLVPFGEYVPFGSLFGLEGKVAPLGFTCEPGKVSTVFRLPGSGVTFSALICFEDTVAALARESVRNGAGFLVDQTNDSWFDRTAAPEQHMSHCVFRCVENRVWAVRSANTGVTCCIDSTGRVVRYLGGDETGTGSFGFLNWHVIPREKGTPQTVYTRHGDRVFALPCGVLAVLALIFTVVCERRERSGNCALESAGGRRDSGVSALEDGREAGDRRSQE